MTHRAREEYLAPSESYSPYSQPGSLLFSHPSAVDNWCHSIPLGQPLTPPDTVSDSGLSDCPDMNGQTWNQGPLPEEPWTTAPEPEYSTTVQPSWPVRGNHHGHSQDLSALDSSWVNASQGPVDMGLSPSLSHESQSTRTLNMMPSEPDLPLLPPGLDLSFISEPSWDSSRPVIYASPQGPPQEYTPTAVSSPQTVPGGYAVGPVYNGYHGSQPEMYGPSQPMYYFHGAQAPYPRRALSDPSFVQGAQTFPRTDEHTISGPQPLNQYRTPQRHMSGAGYAEPAQVSTAQGPKDDATVHTFAATSSGYLPPQSHFVAPVRQVPTPHSDTAPSSRASATGFGPDQGAEEANRYAQYEQDKHMRPEERSDCASACVMIGDTDTTNSFNPACGPVALQSFPSVSGEVKPGLVTPPLDGPSQIQATVVSTSTSGETDEGRYRTHPLYSEGPHADGLYRCPFSSDPSCQHKATKLKCNYDKFVDSHLKPFRCKIDACSKQEFSSTACLLRHEREAHGMHGHGDRPHLCYYTGCERGIPGNGFPRRYNLFDHMKRVHDHREDPAQSISGPEVQGPRKPTGRKRKSPSPADEQPVARRQKREPVPSSSPPMAMLHPGYEQRMPADPEANHRDQNRQRILYSQWANQRDLLEFQMNSVRSPDDEAGLASISQNIEELRRLSHQARHG